MAGGGSSSGGAFGGRPELDYNAAVYSAGALPLHTSTSTFSSVRSSPSASSSFQNQQPAHQQHARSAGMQQELDDILQNDYMHMSHEHRHPASPPALSAAEAAALQLQLQASNSIPAPPPPRFPCSMLPRSH